MGLIGEPVALLDIANCESFVQATLNRSRIAFSAEEREDLLAEGLVLLYELAREYRPLQARPGVDSQPGRFSGYAAMFLPRRLGDAWHRNHCEHRYATDAETGVRGWVHGERASSLDAMTEQGRDTAMPGSLDDLADTADGRRLAATIDQVLAEDRENAVAMGLLMMMDYTPGKAAKQLQISKPEAERAMALIIRCSSRLTSLADT